ncbi:hypothetical protein ACHAXA_000639 [Cyclostephanos tholiformis]|uniref:Glutathione gamma-glutamylcysteinyltransferase n=1 Tax=Cyclostephanos tholiformis TaxID=382380 RepID=A0ABD3SRJ0_9STRA
MADGQRQGGKDDDELIGGRQLAVDPPPNNPPSIGRLFLFHVVLPLLAPAFVTYKLLTDESFRINFPPVVGHLYDLVHRATIAPISKMRSYQDPRLLRLLWRTSSGRAYYRAVANGDDQRGGGWGGNTTTTTATSATAAAAAAATPTRHEPLVEYQVREGCCGSATHRCVLRSLGLSHADLPPQSHGESKPETWSEDIARIARDSSNGRLILSTRIVRPGEYENGVGYDEFVSTLREGLTNGNVRVACNFLRSALMGFEGRWGRYVPSHLIVSLFGGHFSPILGIIDREDVVREDGGVGEVDLMGGGGMRDDERYEDYPYVAIFDTNQKYNGVYFAPARRLYDAIRTIDVGSNKLRAIILVERVET